MDLTELKDLLKKFDMNQIKPTKHGFGRTQDKKRNISYPLVVKHILSVKGLYKFEEQESDFADYRKFKLWFQLNYIMDLNIYVAIPALRINSNLC